MWWFIVFVREYSQDGEKRETTLTVHRGLFPSRMSNYGIQKFLDTMLARQPTGRIGQPSDFAGLVLFLSSVASAHMTGNVIEIDGGSLVSGWKRPEKTKSKIWGTVETELHGKD
jgi:NAD(P)-dependent dehydrogenase (short-subunit alcohol dehydrogenase family)